VGQHLADRSSLIASPDRFLHDLHPPRVRGARGRSIYVDAMRLPFDSVAVLSRPAGGLRTVVLADLLGDDLAAALARSRRLRVPRAEFVRPYAKSEMSPEEIGRALNVHAVALCTVAAVGPCVDVAVDVIDVVREKLVANDKFLVSSREVPALERAILRMIPGAGRVPAKSAPLAEILEARLARAAGDPEMALEILGGAAPLETAATIIEGRLCARVGEARRALLSVRRGVRALQLLARLLARFDADWHGAEVALREALKLDPGSPSTHAMLGDLLLATRRRDAAAPHHRLVAELMPVDARAQIAGAFADYFGAFPIDAVARLAELAEANDWVVRALIAGEDLAHARSAAATPFSRALVAAFAGHEFVIAPFTASERALLFSAAGAIDEAVDCLEIAAADHADDVVFAAVEPLFAPLQSEPRFSMLLRHLGLA